MKMWGRYLLCNGRAAISRRRLHAQTESEVRNVLRGVLEPASQRNVVSVGAVSNITATAERISLTLDLFVPGHPREDEVRAECERRLRETFPKTKEVSVSLLNSGLRQGQQQNPKTASSLHKVQHVVLVSSCKGGVGKSTVAVNLATTLALRGLRVALLDADIYGPSLPLMTTPVDATVRKVQDKPGFIKPLVTREGLKILSFGHVNPKAATGAGGKGAAVMRGPIATRVITQLLAATEWGELDYLLIDMPPGTGDIQITVTQTVTASGAVLVTTPHPLSLADSAKGIAMFEDLKIRPLAIVENMSYFECDHGKRYHPFGPGGRDNLSRVFEKAWSGGADTMAANIADSIASLKRAPMHTIPLNADVSSFDYGADFCSTPVVARSPESEVAGIYKALADDVILELVRQQLDAQALPTINFIESRGGIVLRYFEASKVSEFIIPPAELRVRDAKTGRRISTTAGPKYANDAKPIHFEFKGNYGVAIQWSDGHYADIFPFDVLREIAEELALGKN